jgi:hypothetical protein
MQLNDNIERIENHLSQQMRLASQRSTKTDDSKRKADIKSP